MSKVSGKRPSPALVISILALFVALGGSAYAASKIGTKDIRANAITTGKIKKNAITTSKIKKDAVTGTKVKESSLGAVPNATNAVNATNATNAANWNRYVVLGVTRVAPGQTVPLYSNGPFVFYGRCIDAGGGSTTAYTFVTTSQPNSSMSSEEDNYYNADFNPGTEAQINYEITNNTPETNQYYGLYYGEFTTFSADAKTRLSGYLWSGVNYFGAPCTFWGNVTIES